MMYEHLENGNIFEFLLGEKTFEHVYFGDPHPVREGKYWWREVLKNQLKTLHEGIERALDEPDEAFHRYILKELLQNKNKL